MLFAYYKPYVEPKLAYREYREYCNDTNQKMKSFSDINERRSWTAAILSTNTPINDHLTAIQHLELAMEKSCGERFDLMERSRRDLKNWQNNSVYKNEVEKLLNTKFSVKVLIIM